MIKYSRLVLRKRYHRISKKVMEYSSCMVMVYHFGTKLDTKQAFMRSNLKGSLSLHTSQVAHQSGSYPGFYGMRRLAVFLLPPGRDVSPSQGYSQHYIHRYQFIHLGGETHCECKVSCPRTQRNQENIFDTTQRLWPGLEPGLLNLEASALIIGHSASNEDVGNNTN